MNAANSDEFESAILALVDKIETADVAVAPDVHALPTTAIAAVDCYKDGHGVFLSIDMADHTSVYITITIGEPIEIFHTDPPNKPAVKHLFLVRNSTQ